MKNLIARNGGKFFLRMDVVGAPFDGDYLRRRLGKSASVPITRTRAAEEGSSTVATTSKLPTQARTTSNRTEVPRLSAGQDNSRTRNSDIKGGVGNEFLDLGATRILNTQGTLTVRKTINI
ncbi:hypothetical protein N9Z44_00485 [Mariniblastus sp.]|nr:hypothetical protein [Mariniblastus sp.]